MPGRGYVAFAKSFEPAAAPYLENHRGHLMFVNDEERPFVSAELIRQTSFTGTESEIASCIEALRDAGYSRFTVQIAPSEVDAVEDWGRLCRGFA